jgi:hypothetical protein
MGERWAVVCLAAGLAMAAAPPASAARDGGPSVLPLRSVVLYESGVGYFERRGPVQRHGNLALLVPQNHLDDALMTLVVLTTDGARVGSLSFPSVLAPEAALAESPAPVDAFYQDGPILPLLSALAGLQARLRTVAGESLAGRVIGTARVAEARPVAAGESPDAGGTAEVPVLVFLNDDGALRWFHLDEIESVGPADEPAQTAMDRAVAALSTRRGEAQESIGVSVREGGDLAIGYLAEAPVWRVSYRLVFQERAGRLQGWALVHNDTDEDWNNVAVELVEGRPNSYLFPFVTPRFRYREVVAPEEGLETAPQLAGTNVDQMVAGGSSVYGFGLGDVGMMGSGYGGGGYGVGFGSLGGSGVSASTLLAVGELAAEAQAVAAQRRELLSYHATEPLTLRAHESALVPVLDGPISAERISVVDEADNVLSAIKLRNDSGYALREGPLAVFDGGFAGQSWLPRMYVDDARILPHGADLDVVAVRDDSEATNETRIVRWNQPFAQREGGGPGRLEEHYFHRVRTTWTLTSHAAADRKMCLRVPALQNGRVTGGEVELLTTELDTDQHHSCVWLPAGQELQHVITTEEGLQRSWGPDALTAAVVGELAGLDRLPAASRDVLQAAAARLAEAEQATEAAMSAQSAQLPVSSEIARYRADLAALAGSGADEDVATDVAEALIDAGRRLDELARQTDERSREAAAARKQAVELLRTLPVVEP